MEGYVRVALAAQLDETRALGGLAEIGDRRDQPVLEARRGRQLRQLDTGRCGDVLLVEVRGGVLSHGQEVEDRRRRRC